MKILMLTLTLLYVTNAFGQRYTFVFLHKKNDKQELPKEEVDKIMEGHMANIQRLAKEGKLVAAGPFEGGGGIFIFNSKSAREVMTWLETDPGVKAKRWNVEVLPYIPRKGSVCPVNEPYQMVTYQFVHYVPKGAQNNQAEAKGSLRAHDSYVEKLAVEYPVVTEAIFGKKNGGILVLSGDLNEATISADPAVRSGLLDAHVKKLWIAKGAFCEK